MGKTFANRLISLRQERKISQDELAQALGIARSTIGMYEQGRREPDQDTLISIAKYFDVSSDYLVGLIKSRVDVDHKPDHDLADLGNRLNPDELALLVAYRNADYKTRWEILRELGVK